MPMSSISRPEDHSTWIVIVRERFHNVWGVFCKPMQNVQKPIMAVDGRQATRNTGSQFTVRCVVEAFVFRRRSRASARIEDDILTPWKMKPRGAG
ncbi:MAG: hypothetical protein N838_31135 [Thiohalocapsa sp. PB-PSB1]|nr:MAG: hypothetical protein N838_31135 [Thiohalocapsa sp. PB-PSB1]